MGEEQLTTFQSAHLRWLKQQVNNLQDLRYTRTAPQDLDRQLFAAREELDNYVEELRKTGINISLCVFHTRRSMKGCTAKYG